VRRWLEVLFEIFEALIETGEVFELLIWFIGALWAVLRTVLHHIPAAS